MNLRTTAGEMFTKDEMDEMLRNAVTIVDAHIDDETGTFIRYPGQPVS